MAVNWSVRPCAVYDRADAVVSLLRVMGRNRGTAEGEIAMEKPYMEHDSGSKPCKQVN